MKTLYKQLIILLPENQIVTLFSDITSMICETIINALSKIPKDTINFNGKTRYIIIKY